MRDEFGKVVMNGRWRRAWRKLTPDERAECRKEYRYIREALGLTPLQASGTVNRLVDACTWHH